MILHKKHYFHHPPEFRWVPSLQTSVRSKPLGNTAHLAVSTASSVLSTVCTSSAAGAPDFVFDSLRKYCQDLSMWSPASGAHTF